MARIPQTRRQPPPTSRDVEPEAHALEPPADAEVSQLATMSISTASETMGSKENPGPSSPPPEELQTDHPSESTANGSSTGGGEVVQFRYFYDLPEEIQDMIWEFHGRMPKYSRERIVSVFTDFYTWMATNLLPSDAVLFPPENGWPGFILGNRKGSGKSDFVIDVMRYLPYLKSDSSFEQDLYNIHYKCKVLDYSACSAHDVDEVGDDLLDFYMDAWHQDRGGQEDMIQIAIGRGSGGRDMYLNTISGEMLVEEVRCNHDMTMDVVDYFEWLKEEYRSLRMVRLPMGDVLERHDTRLEREVEEAEVYGQGSEYFPSAIDGQWIKQIYRSHGWPDAFRRAEATQALTDFISHREGAS